MSYLAQIGQQLQRALLSPQDIAAAIEAVMWLAVIAVCTWLAVRLTHILVHRALGRDEASVQHRTFAPVVAGLMRFVIIFVAVVLALGTLHVDVTALLASAGVVGVALGFGAQYLVRDVLAGFSLLSEGIVQVGDIVRVDADTGTVERVGLRILQIRKANGELLTIPNGQIGRIGNLSRDFGVAMVRITVPYRADIAKALDVLRTVAAEWADSESAEAVAPPIVNGAVDVADTGVVLQLSVRVPPGRQWAVGAELRQRALTALSAAGIPIDSRVAVTL